MQIIAPVRFGWIPNALTASRAVLAIAAFAVVFNDNQWALGFWLIAAALITDFLDGLAAKLLHAETRFGAELDPLVDFVLAAAGIAGLAAAGHFPLWAGLLMLGPALFIGYERFFWPKDSRVHQLRPRFSASYLFLTWIGITWAFATHAYGWSWWYVLLTVMVGVLIVLPKRHRVRAWLHPPDYVGPSAKRPGRRS